LRRPFEQSSDTLALELAGWRSRNGRDEPDLLRHLEGCESLAAPVAQRPFIRRACADDGSRDVLAEQFVVDAKTDGVDDVGMESSTSSISFGGDVSRRLAGSSP
jgi:hypothetical protein